MKMAGNGRKWLEIARMARNNSKLLEIAENGRKWLEWLEMAGNG